MLKIIHISGSKIVEDGNKDPLKQDAESKALKRKRMMNLTIPR